VEAIVIEVNNTGRAHVVEAVVQKHQVKKVLIQATVCKAFGNGWISA